MNDSVWREEVTVTAGTTGAPVPVPGYLDNVTVTAKPGASGSMNVQHSVDDPDNLVDWIDWTPGSVTADTSRAVVGAITALRASAVTADGVLIICGIRRRQ